METQRRNFVFNIRARISILESAQKRDRAIVIDLPNLLSTSLVKEKKIEMNIVIDNRQIELNALIQRETNIMSGLEDDLIKETLKKETDIVKEKRLSLKNKKAEAKTDKDEYEELAQQKYVKQREPNSEKSMQNKHKAFLGIGNTLPPYIVKNLADMPNNKGYIYKDCVFYGLKRPENNSQNVTLFEKQRNGVMRIHDITPYDIKIYEKQGKDKKQLVSSRKRRIIPRGRM